MQRKASAVWKGGLKDGKGAVSAASGVLNNTPYSFSTRFENTPGTESRGIDCGSARRMLFHGTFGSVGSCQSNRG